MNPFLSIGPVLFSFVTLLTRMIYINACRYFSILWSKTQVYFVSIKLFCNWFVQFTILWFYSSLKQAVQPELSSFRVLQSSQLFFWCSTGTGSKLWPIKIRAWFPFSFEWMMIYIIVEYIIDYLLLIQTFVCRFWINSVHEIRKYKFKKLLVRTSYLPCTDISTSSWEVAVGLGSIRRHI